MKYSNLSNAQQEEVIGELVERVMAGNMFTWHIDGTSVIAVAGRRQAIEQLAKDDPDFIYGHFTSVLNRRPVDLFGDVENEVRITATEMVGGFLAEYNSAPVAYTLDDLLTRLGVAA